jgi:hypothetical protein
MRFADPLDPTADELRCWARDPHAACPDEMPQDWELIVADWKRIDVILELASGSLPQQRWFLAVLYLLAGDCVRNERGSVNIPQLQTLLARLEDTDSEALSEFRERASELLADPSTFDYSLWCDGGYAYADRPAREADDVRL